MAKAILVVPEENLEEVINVIRLGILIVYNNIGEEVKEQLEKWCYEQEKYIKEDE